MPDCRSLLLHLRSPIGHSGRHYAACCDPGLTAVRRARKQGLNLAYSLGRGADNDRTLWHT